MVPAGSKAKRLLSVNHTTKKILHHHHLHQAKEIEHILRKVLVIEKFALLVWFLIKYIITFIFTKSLLKTI